MFELRGNARKTFVDQENLLLVSAATPWELGIKHALGTLPLSVPAREFVAREIATRGYRVLDVQGAHAERAAVLPYPDPGHRDPFEGFKRHGLGDLVGGLIAAVFVAPANVADTAPMYTLVARPARTGIAIDRLLGDTTYGPARDREKLRREQGVHVLAPVPTLARRGERLNRGAAVVGGGRPWRSERQGGRSSRRAPPGYAARMLLFLSGLLACTGSPESTGDTAGAAECLTVTTLAWYGYDSGAYCCTTYRYDADGKLLSIEIDDGEGTVVWSRTYSYDTDGNLMTEEFYSASNAFTVAYAYDTDGNRLSADRDDNSDGTVDSRSTYTYDADGNRLTEARDGGNDGKVDTRYAYTYDTDGNLHTSEQDSGDDGTVDERFTYSYDDDGNVITEQFEQYCACDDEEQSYTSTYTYDAYGNVLTYSANSGEPSTYTYTYDATGNVLTADFDENGDGIVDARRTYTYDAEGNVLTEELDWSADGTVEFRGTNTYTYGTC